MKSENNKKLMIFISIAIATFAAFLFLGHTAKFEMLAIAPIETGCSESTQKPDTALQYWCTPLQGTNTPKISNSVKLNEISMIGGQEYQAADMTQSKCKYPYICTNVRGYRDSMWYTSYVGTLSAGIPTLMGKGLGGWIFEKVLVDDLGIPYGRNDVLEWNPTKTLYYVPADGAKPAMEGYYGFINEDAILMKQRYAVSTGTYTANLHGSLRITDPGTKDSYSVTWRNDIDGAYSGWEINARWGCHGEWCDDDYDVTFLIALSKPPSSHSESANNYGATYSIIPSQKDISAVWTVKQNEALISDWLNDPDNAFNPAEQELTTWVSKFRRPTKFEGNQKYLSAYYRNIVGLWMNIMAAPIWDTDSNYGDHEIIQPAFSRYPGIWPSDAMYAINGMMDATYNDAELNKLFQDQFDVFVDNMVQTTPRHFAMQIRDSIIKENMQDAPFNCYAWKLYQRTGDKSWLASIYDELTDDIEYRTLKRYDLNAGLYYCVGDECGDGRDSTFAPDFTAQMYWQTMCTIEIAKELCLPNDAAFYAERAAKIAEAFPKFWNQEKGLFWDLDRNNQNQFKYTYIDGNGQLWQPGMYEIPTVTSAQAESMRNLLYTEKWDTPYVMPDVATTDPNYIEPVNTWGWWQGHAWSILAYRVANMLRNWNYDTDAAWFENKMFNMISDYSFGAENYHSDGSGIPGDSASMNSWTMSHLLGMANNYDVKIPKSSASGSCSCLGIEEVCNGIDDDCDGLIDEEDVCAPPQPICGNGVCDETETWQTCPDDCQEPPKRTDLGPIILLITGLICAGLIILAFKKK